MMKSLKITTPVVVVLGLLFVAFGCKQETIERQNPVIQGWNISQPIAEVDGEDITVFATTAEMISVLSSILEEGDDFSSAEVVYDNTNEIYVLTAYGSTHDERTLTGYTILSKTGKDLYVPSERFNHSCSVVLCSSACSYTYSGGAITGCICNGAPATGTCNHTVELIEEPQQ